MSEVVFIWEIHGLFIGKMNVSNRPLLVTLKVFMDLWDILETPSTFYFWVNLVNPKIWTSREGTWGWTPTLFCVHSLDLRFTGCSKQNSACGLLFSLSRVNFHAECLKNREHDFRLSDQVLRTVSESPC